MNYHILWSKEAEITFENNLDYLEKEWNARTILQFINRTDDILNKISHNPKLFPQYRKRDNIHKCVITHQISVYYKVNRDSITLITFWNSYQDYKKMKF
jgi:plasmid stabilization system protein ParE